MIISYEEFCDLLVKHIQEGEDFYINLLKTVIDTPSRYCGLFSLSNANDRINAYKRNPVGRTCVIANGRTYAFINTFAK